MDTNNQRTDYHGLSFFYGEIINKIIAYIKYIVEMEALTNE